MHNDSVLEVDKWDYYHCNTSNPIIAFDNGKSIMKLDRPGPFYFISGAHDHCKNGQRIFIDVMDPRLVSQSPPPGAVPPEPYLSDSPSLGVAIAVAPCAPFMALIVTFLASVVYV
ncbi:early nodulin-like protein 7 [Prunus dulcis]|uniref:Early nodulin-like protein 7 n=1 Tax=Prunus dulcis TaxID=3755 RepID=A0A4Y1R4B6_PRUDU|nr:early nodulin-like protein 7 [Prunus dulcis]